MNLPEVLGSPITTVAASRASSLLHPSTLRTYRRFPPAEPVGDGRWAGESSSRGSTASPSINYFRCPKCGVEIGCVDPGATPTCSGSKSRFEHEPVVMRRVK